MTKNRIVKYVANTALLAVLAAAGIGAYQLGTSKPKEIQKETEFAGDSQEEEIPIVMQERARWKQIWKIHQVILQERKTGRIV